MQTKSRPQTATYSNISNLKNHSVSVTKAVSKTSQSKKTLDVRPEWNN